MTMYSLTTVILRWFYFLLNFDFQHKRRFSSKLNFPFTERLKINESIHVINVQTNIAVDKNLRTEHKIEHGVKVFQLEV